MNQPKLGDRGLAGIRNTSIGIESAGCFVHDLTERLIRPMSQLGIDRTSRESGTGRYLLESGGDARTDFGSH